MKKLQSFKEFWPYYLGEHRSPVNRALHYIGTSTAIGILSYTVYAGRPTLLWTALLAGYGCAWVGHFIIEKNRPATFTYPGWSLLGDFKMLYCFVTGQITGELTRTYGSTSPTADAPLLTTPDR